MDANDVTSSTLDKAAAAIESAAAILETRERELQQIKSAHAVSLQSLSYLSKAFQADTMLPRLKALQDLGMFEGTALEKVAGSIEKDPSRILQILDQVLHKVAGYPEQGRGVDPRTDDSVDPKDVDGWLTPLRTSRR